MIVKESVSTSGRIDFIDITGLVRNAVRKSGCAEGMVLVYCPHTTGAVTINENADPDVAADIEKKLTALVPHRDGYAHMEGNSDAHVKSSLVGASETIPLQGGDLVLGTWQGIYFCEFDGPRRRSVHIQVIGS